MTWSLCGCLKQIGEQQLVLSVGARGWIVSWVILSQNRIKESANFWKVYGTMLRWCLEWNLMPQICSIRYGFGDRRDSPQHQFHHHTGSADTRGLALSCIRRNPVPTEPTYVLISVLNSQGTSDKDKESCAASQRKASSNRYEPSAQVVKSARKVESREIVCGHYLQKHSLIEVVFVIASHFHLLPLPIAQKWLKWQSQSSITGQADLSKCTSLGIPLCPLFFWAVYNPSDMWLVLKQCLKEKGAASWNNESILLIQNTAGYSNDLLQLI